MAPSSLISLLLIAGVEREGGSDGSSNCWIAHHGYSRPWAPGGMRFQQVEPFFTFAGHAGAIPVNLPNVGLTRPFQPGQLPREGDQAQDEAHFGHGATLALGNVKLPVSY